ncbi:hypothetical protein COOONC_08250 [Cooperia oncophora]
MTAIDLETYPLHKAAFFNDVHSISQLIKAGRSLYEQDMHGNTALHISTMLGHRVTEMLRKLKAQSRMGMTSRKAHLIKMLEDIGDFYLELKWDFQSWIPLLSRMLPSDVCQIYKKGTQLRMDTTLADFKRRYSVTRWDAVHISFVFNAKAKYESDELIIMDNNAKVFQRVRHEESEAEVDEEVDVLMSSDIVSAQEQIGDYNVNFYLVEGMRLVSRKRREHLTADDIKKNKSFMQSLASGAAVGDEDFKSLQHRKSLAPPGRMPTTWEEYSEDFPMGIDVLLDILEIVAPFKHLDKLRRFCEARLPPGFPVRVEIPLLPTISAKVTFQKLQFVTNLSDKIFFVPASYREDPTRFPDL